MNYSNYRITLDVRNTVSNVQLTAKKGDAGRKVYITLSDKGKPCELEDGLYAVFAGVKPDGKLLYNKTTIENNTIIYEMTKQTTAVPGLVACEVKLFDSMTNLLTSPKLTILVDDVVVPDEEIVSKDEVTAFAELVFDAKAMIDLGNDTIEAGKAATQAANAAAQSANDAATGANQAKENANSAANAASSAASRTEQAVSNANTATANANTAAENARTATAETNAFLENAENALETIQEIVQDGEGASPIVCTAEGKTITANDSDDRMLRGLTVYGKTTQDGTPTPSKPVELVSVGNSGSIKEIVAGKNLIDLLNPLRESDSLAGTVEITKTLNSVIMSGVRNSAWSVFSCYYYLYPGTYTYSAKMETDNGYLNLGLYVSNNLNGGYTYKTALNSSGYKTFTLTEPTYIEVRCHFTGETSTNGATWTTRYYDIQIEKGNVATEPVATAFQSLTLSTPNGLPGIPVSSGGNYTDENGQQWICDEIDLARGKYVQRVNQVRVTKQDGIYSVGTYVRCQFKVPRGNNYYYNKAMNTHFPYSGNYEGEFEHAYIWSDLIYWFLPNETASTQAEVNDWLSNNNFRFVYVLETPIETDLSAEEKAAFAALHSNKPTTTVYNDAGAVQKLSYVADTKTYIDNKFAALSAALLNN